MADDVLNLDFDALTIDEVDFLEDTLNEKLRPLLGDKIVTFQDVIANFRDGEPALKIPQGKLLRVIGWMQLRKSNPAATWEDAGRLKLAAPKAEMPPPVTVPEDGEPPTTS